MADVYDVLTDVKNALGITGNYQDNTLNVYINDIKDYLKKAGVPESAINSQASAGTIARGVADLWNYGAGEGKLSPYFYERAIQLAVGNPKDRSGDEIDDYATESDIHALFK